MFYNKKRDAVQSHSLAIGDDSIHYRTLGDPEKEPLVLLHGYGNSGHIWEYIQPYLAEQRHLFLVDLPGFGRSKMSGKWQLQAMAPMLVRWLQEMHLAPVALLGHSMGGAIAIHIAALAPELIEQLVLISAVGIPMQAGLPDLAARSLRSFLQRGNGPYPTALLLEFAQPRLRLLWQSAQEIRRSDLRNELNGIKVPTLIIWGEQDILIPISVGRDLSTALPHAQFITMPGCGHRPMTAQPIELSQIILHFLETH